MPNTRDRRGSMDSPMVGQTAETPALTALQREIVRGIVSGQTNAEIAAGQAVNARHGRNPRGADRGAAGPRLPRRHRALGRRPVALTACPWQASCSSSVVV